MCLRKVQTRGCVFVIKQQVVSVAVGYKDPEGWVTEGWWNMTPACASGS